MNHQTMADLAFVQQHNMVSYLEKNDGNADFHQILDFLTSSSINFALTVSPTIYASYIEQFWNTASLKTINSKKQIHANVDGKAMVVSESSTRRDLQLNDEDVAIATVSQSPKDPNTFRRTKRGWNTKVPQSGGSPKTVGDEAINEEMFDSVERAITTDASLDAAHDMVLGTKKPWGAPTQTRSERVLKQPIEPPLSEGHTSRSEEGRMEHQFELTANVPITPHDSPLLGGYTPGSDEGRLKLQELMTMCTKLSKQVLEVIPELP
ncbi:hypothetical protein Tco_0722931 [Tanacetum coccineum]